MTYAENTSVSAERSRAEIETVLKRYGADSFGYMANADSSTVMFQCRGRTIKITIAVPDGSKLKRSAGQRRGWPSEIQREAWVEQETRRRWRALVLVIKAKLEAVQSSIATFETEFLPYTIIVNGLTFAEWAEPQLKEMAQTGRMPLMLNAGGEP